MKNKVKKYLKTKSEAEISEIIKHPAPFLSVIDFKNRVSKIVHSPSGLFCML